MENHPIFGAALANQEECETLEICFKKRKSKNKNGFIPPIGIKIDSAKSLAFIDTMLGLLLVTAIYMFINLLYLLLLIITVFQKGEHQNWN